VQVIAVQFSWLKLLELSSASISWLITVL